MPGRARVATRELSSMITLKIMLCQPTRFHETESYDEGKIKTPSREFIVSVQSSVYRKGLVHYAGLILAQCSTTIFLSYEC